MVNRVNVWIMLHWVYMGGVCVGFFPLCSLYAIAYTERAKEHSVRAKEHCFKIVKCLIFNSKVFFKRAKDGLRKV